MNRLVIIGNGFDLAHGLPTGYCDFINDYWRNVYLKLSEQEIFEMNYDDKFVEIQILYNNTHHTSSLEAFKNIDSYNAFVNFLNNYNNSEFGQNFRYNFKFKNSLFKKINDRHYIQNWVDVENEYYKNLKECLSESSNTKVKKLNEEFEQVKNLLDEYLNKNITQKFDFSQLNDEAKEMSKIFNVWNRYIDWEKFREEFSKNDRKEIQEHYNILKEYNNGGYHISNFIKSKSTEIENLFLNFNYTTTLDSYITLMENTDENYYGKNRLIQIHGKLNNDSNKINFGFGDEMDDDYKKIENKDDNEYLRNIKSFQYLQNSNYKDMLDFIDSYTFQVYIMGHSCGLSDRILLNKIFEHHNCRSIKVFYHKFNESKPDGREDNFTEIIQNISRHFNKKEMMREKIVNKSLCQPLPQSVRFAEK